MEGLDPELSKKIARDALDEDGAWNDATVDFLQIGAKNVEAEVVAEGKGVICGLGLARECFGLVEPAIRFDTSVNDGGSVAPGDVLCRLGGSARAILSAERVALNFLQRLSGIATLSALFVKEVAHAGITILDTRKTTPLLRDIEKYAVRCGGAQNHRRDLGSMILIKENHIRSLGGNRELIGYLKARTAGTFVEVEIDSLGFLKDILGAPVNRVMFDNFTPSQVREGLKLIDEFSGGRGAARPEVEVSGGITLKNAKEYAIPGVDYISVGALTHSAPALPLSLEVS